MMTGVKVYVLAACIALFGSFAHAESKKKPAKLSAVMGRVVDLDVNADARIVTVMAGSNNGIAKTWKAKFIDASTKKPLADGEAILIRVDKRTTVLKTKLSAEQVRANRAVQFEP